MTSITVTPNAKLLVLTSVCFLVFIKRRSDGLLIYHNCDYYRLVLFYSIVVDCVIKSSVCVSVCVRACISVKYFIEGYFSISFTFVFYQCLKLLKVVDKTTAVNIYPYLINFD